MRNILGPDFGMELASLSPVLGCSGGCAYCYLDTRSITAPVINQFGVRESLTALERVGMVYGKDGTIVCIGGWGEPFPRNKQLCQESIAWIREVALLGNPIMITTKGSLSDEEIDMLKSMMLYQNQILMCISITSLSFWKDLEPRTTPPERRIEFLRRWCEAGLSGGVLINPFLKGITDLEYEKILKLISDINISGLVISPLFFNDTLIQKMTQNSALRCILKNSATNTEKPRMKNDEFVVEGDSLSPISSQLCETAGKFGIPCWKHYLCLLNHFYNRKNPAVYLSAEFCQKCGNCHID